jgi:hypothetical protein
MTRNQAIAVVVALLGSLAVPTAAAASRASVDVLGPAISPGPNNIDFLVQTVSVTYLADPGETNKLSALRTEGGWTLTDPGASIFAPQCTVSPDGHNAFCPRPATTQRLRELLHVDAGDGDDGVQVAWPAAQDPSLFASGAILSGGAGDDTLSGGDLADDIRGGAGDDRLSGANGNDEVSGDAGRDALTGGAGDDTLDSRDGEAEVVDCGPGADRVLADALDIVAACESDGTIPAALSPAPGPPAAVPDRSAPSADVGLPLRPRRIGTLVRFGLVVTVRASEASTISATLHRGGAKGASTGRVSSKLQASGRVRLRLRPTASARRTLSGHDSVRLTLRVQVTDRAGNRRVIDRRFTVKR